MPFLRALVTPNLLRTTARTAQPAAFAFRQSQRWQQMLKTPPRAATYSAAAGLKKDEVEARILDVFKGFEKVDPAKLSTSASFQQDLGLDSLDAVEVVMAVEEEFSIEIPDAEADEINTVQQAIDYILQSPEAQ